MGTPRAPSTIKVDPMFAVGRLNRRLFGSFLEHLGRCIYTGIYEPGHPQADEHGFRNDVSELITELGPTIIRYPGGNFVSAYDWRDGIGPAGQRPVRYDLAWNATETNQVGTDEFLQWCARLQVEPMLTVNLGTAGTREAVELLEYVNGAPGFAVADERGRNGHPQPYGVGVWCLGNEMDGPWQIGFKTPEEYGRLATETGRAMKRFDSSVELVACGSSMLSMPTFGRWEREVLDLCFDQVDHISAHSYYEPIDGDDQSFLASAAGMDRFISATTAAADHVAATKQSDKSISISFDEWGVWFEARNSGKDPEKDEITGIYDVQEAVVIGSLLIELIRHTDRVAIACHSALVNMISPILTSPGGSAWRQTIFYPFALTSRYAKSTVLSVAATSPSIDTERYGTVNQLHSVATYDPSTDDLVIFATNRGTQTALDLEVDLSGFGSKDWVVVEHLMIADDDPHGVNTQSEPNRVVPVTGDARSESHRIRAGLPATSWHCIRLASATSG